MKKYIVGNWKMQLGIAESKSLAAELKNKIVISSNLEVWVSPSPLAIPAVQEILSTSQIKVGAQNICGEAKGAFTGEISVSALKEIGASFGILGHSERRNVFGESNQVCANRALGALKQGFTIIFCVGETLEQRQQKWTNQVLEEQLSPLFADLTEIEKKNLIIAYEPVWAIGTGLVADNTQIHDAHAEIARLISEVPILYGGSVTPENFAEINKIDRVDGALVGGASLVVEKFKGLVEIANN